MEANTVLAYSGIRYHYNRHSSGQIEGFPLQLVQCMHRKTAVQWIERAELESDDLERLCWAQLRPLGIFTGTNSLTYLTNPHLSPHHVDITDKKEASCRIRPQQSA